MMFEAHPSHILSDVKSLNEMPMSQGKRDPMESSNNRCREATGDYQSSFRDVVKRPFREPRAAERVSEPSSKQLV